MDTTQLAYNYDPAPLLAHVQQRQAQNPTGPWAGQGDIPASPYGDSPFSSMINPGETGGTPTAKPGGLSPASLMMLNGMMPKPSQPHFMAGVAPRPAAPINLHLAVTPGQPAAPTLGQLLQGR